MPNLTWRVSRSRTGRQAEWLEQDREEGYEKSDDPYDYPPLLADG